MVSSLNKIDLEEKVLIYILFVRVAILLLLITVLGISERMEFIGMLFIYTVLEVYKIGEERMNKKRYAAPFVLAMSLFMISFVFQGSEFSQNLNGVISFIILTMFAVNTYHVMQYYWRVMYGKLN